MRVRDMPRQQQKAVFARKTDDGYLATLQGAEKFQRRRNYLIKRNELAETYEDKIFNAYNNPRLTHRQRMAKITQLKKEAAKKLSKYKTEESESTVGEWREENLRKFKKEYEIEEVPTNKNLTFKQLKKKGIVLSKTGDADKDGVKNIKDCRPLNKKKHIAGLAGTVALGVASSYAGSKLAKSTEKKKEKIKADQHGH